MTRIVKVLNQRSQILYLISFLFIPYILHSQNSIQNILPKIQDAVFTVYANLDDGISQGSGFFISTEGIGVTNYHVLDGANTARIVTRGGKEYAIARILDYDADMDLVKFKIEKPQSISFQSLRIQNVLPKKGSPVLSLSTPIGFEQTVSTGIVSALRSDDIHGAIIQITAPISHGSSGSPVLNMSGEVIGVATFGYEQGQSINFAVAANQINKLHKSLNITIEKMGRNPLETINVKNARRYFQQGEYGKAVESLDLEIKQNPQNHLALYTLSRIFYDTQTTANDRIRAINDAIVCAHQATVLDPYCSEYYCQVGLALTSLGMENKWDGEKGESICEMAVKSFQMSLQMDSLNLNAIYGLAKILCEVSSPSSRIKFSEEVRKSNYLYAIDLLSFIVMVIPNEDCYNYLIKANQNLGEYGKAILYCDKAITFNPDWYRGYLLRGDIKIFDMDMFNEGLLDLERALALCESPFYKADIYALRGTAYEQKAFKDKKSMAHFVNKALSDYQKAYELTQDPKYHRYEDELVNRFNNSKVSKNNL